MTGTEPKTVTSYLAALPPDVAQIVQQVRETLRSVAPDLDERISYQILRFDYAGTYLYVGAWKNHLGLYPIYPAEPELEAEIAPFRARKDTVQFVYKRPIPYDLLARIAPG